MLLDLTFVSYIKKSKEPRLVYVENMEPEDVATVNVHGYLLTALQKEN